MGAAQSAPITSPNIAAVSDSVCEVNPLNPKGLKPCCACPETKSARDDCFLKNDPAIADETCKELVQRHIACMRAYGFKI